MTRKLAAILFGLSVMGAATPVFAGPEQSFEVTSTERVSFSPGGTIILNNSYGYLTVEGWDEPEVEITVTKSTNRFYQPDQKEKAEMHFDEIRVAAERRSDKELAISTTLPVRHGFPASVLPSRRIVVTMPKTSKRGVTVEYTVHVPRDSRVVVHQDNGYVWVSDVTGDISVDSHTGDMIVMLPDPGPYSIDARTRMGSVSSDFTGQGHKQFLVGSQFVHATQAQSRRILLRMGRGNITIKSGPPSGPFWKN
ncbi:MAG: hypothetical protein ABSF25_14490 [Bryobacteraceae bacterium]|jgi:hypothetical protein